MSSADDLDVLTVNNRRLERENKELRLTLWDQYFMAAIGTCLKHGQVTGTKMAVAVADEMMAAREARNK